MDGHPCGDTRQNPGYVGSRPLPGPATSAGPVISGGSWHAGVSDIGVSGIGAYRPTHVPEPALLQLANRVSHLLPTFTNHPASAQPSTDTHRPLSFGKTKGFSVRRLTDNAACRASMRVQPENRGSQRNPTVLANHPRARPSSCTTVLTPTRGLAYVFFEHCSSYVTVLTLGRPHVHAPVTNRK